MKSNRITSAGHSSNTIVSRSQLKPILFSSEMVKAILAGRKTQTRRAKGLKWIDDKATEVVENNGWPKQGNFAAKLKYQNSDGKGKPDAWEITNIVKSPYKVGDILWVRETSRIIHINHSLESASFFTIQFKDNSVLDYQKVKPIQFELGDEFYKKAYEIGITDIAFGKWKPSLFMPKSSCRIFLEVTDVKVERLGQISEEDAVNEGVDFDYSEGIQFKNYDKGSLCYEFCDPLRSYESLWCSINGSYDKNQWVWVITFKVVECPQGFC